MRKTYFKRSSSASYKFKSVCILTNPKLVKIGFKIMHHSTLFFATFCEFFSERTINQSMPVRFIQIKLVIRSKTPKMAFFGDSNEVLQRESDFFTEIAGSGFWNS